MGIHYFTSPRNIKVNLLNNCTRRCSFCGCRTANNYGTRDSMTKETFIRLLDGIDTSNKMLEFGVFSEPLLHPLVTRFVYLAKSTFPHLQITIITNGDKLTPELLTELFDSGLNYLFIDAYDNKALTKAKEAIKERPEDVNAEWFHVTAKSPWTYRKNPGKNILLCAEFNLKRKNNRFIHTHGGRLHKDQWAKYGIRKEEFPLLKKCTQPFRMATINYDGSFLLCCCDWNKDILFGNIKEKTVNEIWNNEKYEKVRYLLNKGRRDLIKTCFYCNARSHRVGLTGYRGRRYEETKLK